MSDLPTIPLVEDDAPPGAPAPGDADAGDDDAHLDDVGPPPSAPAAAPAGVPAPAAAAAGRPLRCFIAIHFPLATTRRIADEIAALTAPVAAIGLRVRWVPAPNLHLTLRFLGPIRPTVIEAIRARLQSGARDQRPFEMEARGLGAFPALDRARVLWVGVRDEPALVALQQQLDAWLGELGFPREERPFHPHVTIGRVTGGRGDLAALFAEHNARAFGRGRVVDLVIYESRTLARGAEYHVLGRVPLSR